MANIVKMESYLKTLPEDELLGLFDFIGEILTFGSIKSSLNTEIKESRFSKGQICPHCGANSVKKNGKANGLQRYFCNSCKKTFSEFSLSPLAYSKLPLDKWVAYAKGMVLGFSIRKNAREVGVCVKTSFYMRHKVLDCIRVYMGIGDVDGLVEMDETFFPLSYKGNHKKSGFKMPRPARKRGKQIQLRGISRDQVCVASALDRNGNIIMESVCTGRISYKTLERLYAGRIDENSIICTDSHKSYIRFAKDFKLDHKRIPSGHHTNGIYHINHVNSLHSNLKLWMRKFRGIATKYLPNYLNWYKWVESFSSEKDAIKTKNILIHSATPFVDTKIVNFKRRVIQFT